MAAPTRTCRGPPCAGRRLPSHGRCGAWASAGARPTVAARRLGRSGCARCACHAICALVDFTEENGATRVVPGSHRNPYLLKRRSDPRKPHPAQRRLIGAEGTVFLLNIHCAHSAVHNRSDEPRLAVLTHFSRRDSPLQEVQPAPGAESRDAGAP
ncbi:MAG: hypothetical protein CMJ59_16070 [Planctomycetaceae bacterium]|nr:hypothetical protein [Planctomycetaceae bacterium]